MVRLAHIAYVGAMLTVLSAAAPVHAVGYWNLPGNVAQWWGYGWGAGHHACLVLGPVSHEGAFAHNHVRLPHAPRPSYGSYGESTYNYDFRQPWPSASDEFQSSPTLTPQPLPMRGATQAPTAIPTPVEP